MKKLTVGSCFSGIGGLELGLERTGGFETKWQIENDPYASAVLKKHWRAVVRYGDIKSVDAESLERVDLICGGFPCQDISDAGKRAGISGERSGLWRELLRTIRVVRPRNAILENVAALLRRGMGTVLGDLAESRYDTEWDCLPASSVGAPHQRDRIFIVADAAGTEVRSRPKKIDSRKSEQTVGLGVGGQNVAHSHRKLLDGRRRKGNRRSESSDRSEVCNAASSGLSDGRTASVGGCEAISELERSNWWSTEPDVGRVAHGVPSRVDRLRCLGNAVVPQVAEKVGRMILGMRG